jgi:hypothetical protein
MGLREKSKLNEYYMKTTWKHGRNRNRDKSRSKRKGKRRKLRIKVGKRELTEKVYLLKRCHQNYVEIVRVAF